MPELHLWDCDPQFEDRAVEKVEQEGAAYVATFDDGFSLFVQDERATGLRPFAGDRLRLWGKGFGYHVRGIGLVQGGVLVGVFRYESEAELEARSKREREEAKRKKTADWEAKREDTLARVKALPEPFRLRLEFFMRSSQEWGPEYGFYELFTCEEAAKLAAYARTVPGLDALKADRELQQQAGVSDQHSGNTFGAACSLARLFLTEPALVPKWHGALCPLVGCEAYGCYAATDEARRATATEAPHG